MLHRCLLVSQLINQSLKLNALPSTTCIRQYAMTYDEEEREKKIKTRVIKVNLIMPDQKVSSMTMEQAQKLAKRRNLHMTLLHDPPKFASYAGRDVYEMVTHSTHVKQSAESAEITNEDPQNECKEKKTLTFSNNIAEHDMLNKLKQIKKLLSKRHGVIVIIADAGTGDTLKEKVKLIETECKDLSNITIVNKKKQAVITLLPQIIQAEGISELPGNNKTRSKKEPTPGSYKFWSKKEPTPGNNEAKNKQEPTTT